MQSLVIKKTKKGLGCKFTCAWEFEKRNPIGTSVDTEKALFLLQRLLELEKSDALFKHLILSSIDILQKRMGRIYLFERISTLDIDLGVTNAQCIRFERLNQPLHLVGSTPQGANDYTLQLFSVYDEDTISDTSFR